jgi:hypothetical protein
MTETANPFRHPLYRNSASFRTTVWQANDEGKDTSSGKTDFAIGDDYLWISYDFSVPLQWITLVEDRGPGFVIAWRNHLTGANEAAAFCVRTAFGYDRKRRDELVALVKSAITSARSRPGNATVAQAEAAPRCEVCGAPNPHVYEFTWMASVFMFLLSKPNRRVLCTQHAKWRTRRVVFTNLIISNLGLGVLISPIFCLRNIREARKGGAISAVEAALWLMVGFVPYLAIGYLVGWSIWYAITF